MRGKRLAPLLTAALGLLGACGPRPPCDLRICDIREVGCQQDIARATACLRGQAAVEVPIRVVAQAAYIAQVEAENAGANPESFQRWLQAYAHFGLADPTISVSAHSREQAAWVAAYYQSGGQGITVIDAGRPLASAQAVSLLVHEVTHALQDKAVGFEAFGKLVGAVDLDRVLASKAVTEGEASLIEDLSAVGLFGAHERDVAWAEVFGNWQARSRRAAVASRLPVSLAWGQFPYSFGAPYVHAAYRAEGFAGVDRLYREPPLSSGQVLAGPGGRETTGRPWVEDMMSEAVPALPGRFAFLGADRLGAWILEVFLARLLNEGRVPAEAAAALRPAPVALRADAFSIFHDAVAGETAACWRMRFATADVTRAVMAAVRAAAVPTWSSWMAERDLFILASDRAETRALGAPQLAFQAPPPVAMTSAASASAAMGAPPGLHAPLAGTTCALHR